MHVVTEPAGAGDRAEPHTPAVPDGGITSTLGHLVFRHRDWLVPLALCLLVAVSRAPDFLASGRLDSALDAAGAVLVVAGLALRIVVAASIGIRRSGLRRRIAASRLLREGLYAHTRNPLYLANMVTVAGLLLVYDSRWAWMIAVPAVGLWFFSLVRAEEQFLSHKFGAAYDDYRAHVGRLWPRVRGVRASLAGSGLDWKRALRREYGTVFAATSVMLGLIAAKSVARVGLHPTRASFGLTSLWLALVALYVVVRRLKKTGRLESAPAGPPAPVGADR